MPSKVPDPDNASRPVTDPHEDSTEGLNAGLRPTKGSTDPKFGPSSKTYGKDTGTGVRQVIEKEGTAPVSDEPDWCAICRELTMAFYSVGGMIKSLKTRTLDAEESVSYTEQKSQTVEQRMKEACYMCKAIQGLVSTPYRHAIGLFHKSRCCKPRRP